MSKNIYLVLTFSGLNSPNFIALIPVLQAKLQVLKIFLSEAQNQVSPHDSQIHYTLKKQNNKDKSQPLNVTSLISKFHTHSHRIKLPHKITILQLTFSQFLLYLYIYPCFLLIEVNSMILLLQVLYFSVYLLII